MYCMKCGSYLNESLSFCTKCGTPVIKASDEDEFIRGAEAYECPCCGNKAAANDAYCTNCGATLARTERVAEPLPAKVHSRHGSNRHTSLRVVGILLGLACVLIAAALLCFGQLSEFRNVISVLPFVNGEQSTPKGEGSGYIDGDPQMGDGFQANGTSNPSESNTRAIISISQVDCSSYPNNILYMSVQDAQGNNISNLKAAECTILEIVPTGGEVSASVSGLQLVSQDGSTYKASYVSNVEVEAGYYLTVRLNIETGSGVTGTAETTYAVKTNSNTENAVPAQTSPGMSNQVTQDNSGSADYILPESDSRYYSKTEIQALSDWELEIARNEIYARHGRGFKDKDLQKYFDSRTWYYKRYSAAEFDALPSPLNEYEKSNVALIGQVEASR